MWSFLSVLHPLRIPIPMHEKKFRVQQENSYKITYCLGTAEKSSSSPCTAGVFVWDCGMLGGAGVKKNPTFLCLGWFKKFHNGTECTVSVIFWVKKITTNLLYYTRYAIRSPVNYKKIRCYVGQVLLV